MEPAASTLQHRLLAILQADAVGYSRLMSQDDVGTLSALEAARALFRQCALDHGGRVVDTAGDSVVAAFDTATGAVQAAAQVQSRVAAAPGGTPGPGPLAFRVGIHLRDVIIQPDGTLYGEGVNMAARLQALAETGGILVSEAVRAAVRPEIAT
jgi:adenylate cyclase